MTQKKIQEAELDAVVVLQEMWDWASRTTAFGYTEMAPLWYTINPENKSGKMLYNLLGDKRFLVTNACPELVRSPNHRGKPDPKYLGGNLYALMYKYHYNMLLVCGKVAWETYLASRKWYHPQCRVVKMKHPAARDWTKEEVEQWQRRLL
jgi:hypothetical protein